MDEQTKATTVEFLRAALGGFALLFLSLMTFVLALIADSNDEVIDRNGSFLALVAVPIAVTVCLRLASKRDLVPRLALAAALALGYWAYSRGWETSPDVSGVPQDAMPRLNFFLASMVYGTLPAVVLTPLVNRALENRRHPD